jgi:pilus assembly protein Flp/PilA
MFRSSSGKKQRGQGLVEYALILVLIAVVVIVALSLLGPNIGGVFSDILDQLEAATDSSPDLGPGPLPTEDPYP